MTSSPNSTSMIFNQMVMGTTFVTLLNMGMVSFSLLGKKRYGDRWLVTGSYKKTSSLGPQKKNLGKITFYILIVFLLGSYMFCTLSTALGTQQTMKPQQEKQWNERKEKKNKNKRDKSNGKEMKPLLLFCLLFCSSN